VVRGRPWRLAIALIATTEQQFQTLQLVVPAHSPPSFTSRTNPAPVIHNADARLAACRIPMELEVQSQ
jgi:hypothetical protein